jgi:hypothetical protein
MSVAPVDATTFVSPAGATVRFLEPDEQGRPEYVFASRAFRRVR